MLASTAIRFCRAACLGGRKPSKKNRSVGSPATDKAVRTADAPGIAITRVTGVMSRPHQLVAGIRYQRRARVRHQCDRLAVREASEQLRPRFGGVMFVVRREWRCDAVTFGQLAGDAGILAGNDIGTREQFQRTQADIAQVPDWRGDKIEARYGFCGLNRCAEWGITAGPRCAVIRHKGHSRRPCFARHRRQILSVLHTLNFCATKSVIPVTTDTKASRGERLCRASRVRRGH